MYISRAAPERETSTNFWRKWSEGLPSSWSSRGLLPICSGHLFELSGKDFKTDILCAVDLQNSWV